MTKLLNQNAILDEPMKQEIFERGDVLLYQKLQKHSQVFAERLDMHGRDEDIRKVLQRLAEKERRKGLDPAYLCVREVGESGNNHYHTIFFLNGNKTRSIWPLFEDANRVMNNVLGEKSDKKSGLINAMHVLANVEGIAMVQLTAKDVVRHEMVQRIVKAYEDYEGKNRSDRRDKNTRKK